MAEEMMKLDRKTGVVEETPYTPLPNLPPIQPNRKAMRQIMLPNVGDMIEGKYKVIYVNDGQFRFSAVGPLPLPSVGSMYESDGRMYEVERTDETKRKFNAKFKGFKQNPVAESPVEIEEDLAKVI
jgi:hypothetical protein